MSADNRAQLEEQDQQQSARSMAKVEYFDPKWRDKSSGDEIIQFHTFSNLVA